MSDRLLSGLRPDFVVKEVEDIYPPMGSPDSALILQGINLIAFDVDGTLTDYHSELDRKVNNLLFRLGFTAIERCVISNSYGERAEHITSVFRNVFGMEVWTPERVASSLDDSRVKAYRKPNPAMLTAAMLHYGVEPQNTLMVGDQLLKDVRSAKRAGAKSALVQRRGTGDHFAVKYLQRPIEAVARKLMGLELGD